jgi:hypothetical protein
MKTMKDLLTTARGLATRNKNFNADLQALLVDAAEHAFSTAKNVEPIRQVILNGKEFRFTGIDNAVLIAWVEKYLPARWNAKALKFHHKKMECAFDREFLMAQCWWKKAKRPNDVASSIDYLEMVRSLVKRMEKEARVQVNGAPREVKHAELLTKLATIANDKEYAVVTDDEDEDDEGDQ